MFRVGPQLLLHLLVESASLPHKSNCLESSTAPLSFVVSYRHHWIKVREIPIYICLANQDPRPPPPPHSRLLPRKVSLARSRPGFIGERCQATERKGTRTVVVSCILVHSPLWPQKPRSEKSGVGLSLLNTLYPHLRANELQS